MRYVEKRQKKSERDSYTINEIEQRNRVKTRIRNNTPLFRCISKFSYAASAHSMRLCTHMAKIRRKHFINSSAIFAPETETGLVQRSFQTRLGFSFL